MASITYNMEERKNIALVCGGYSKEYDVSIRSAAQIATQIDTSIYNVYKIVIDRNKWYYMPEIIYWQI